MTANNPGTFFDFADQLALVSSEVLRFRIKSRETLTPAEKSRLENLEIELDGATAKVRAEGIAALGELTNANREEVEAATNEAGSALRRIKRVERAFAIAGGVLDLALAIIDKKPKDILAALKEVRKAVA